MNTNLKNLFGKSQMAVGLALMALAGNAAAAQPTTLKDSLTSLLCAVSSSESSIPMFAGGAAIISFLIMFTLGEGKEGVATILKIAIGLSCLIFLPTIMKLFGFTFNCVQGGMVF